MDSVPIGIADRRQGYNSALGSGADGFEIIPLSGSYCCMHPAKEPYKDICACLGSRYTISCDGSAISSAR